MVRAIRLSRMESILEVRKEWMESILVFRAMWFLGEGRLALDEAIDSLLQAIRGDLASVVFGND